MKTIIILIITLYQQTLSPDHGAPAAFYPHGFCRFYPSCSEYMKNAVQRDGISRGVVRGLARIGRCNPWTKGGIDL